MSNLSLALLVVFAAIGVLAVVLAMTWLAFTCFRIIRDLAGTLKEAVEIAKIYRKDINAFHEMMQPPSTRWGESDGPAPSEEPKAPTPMPSPVWGSFQTREPEPEAANEPADDVDVTATEEEIAEKEEAERLLEMSGKLQPPPNFGQEP